MEISPSMVVSRVMIANGVIFRRLAYCKHACFSLKQSENQNNHQHVAKPKTVVGQLIDRTVGRPDSWSIGQLVDWTLGRPDRGLRLRPKP